MLGSVNEFEFQTSCISRNGSSIRSLRIEYNRYHLSRLITNLLSTYLARTHWGSSSTEVKYVTVASEY
uniref:Uncharacterized protein n=1 Tax=Pararge aegeria TaxID=116150 RepID=S4PDU1_9NEOP